MLESLALFLGHVLNFMLPALGVALLATGLARLAWWRAWPKAWQGAALWRLVRDAAVLNLLVLLAGLWLLRRDGAMLTYAALVLATAATLWWRALRHARP